MTVRHFPLDRLAQALRASGRTVAMVDGAQGRSARRFASVGYYRGCQAMVNHHTASSGRNPAWDVQFIIDGKGDGMVIANAYTAVDGTIHLIASGPTYTEGAGGPYGIIPQDRGNDVAFSNEIANPGDGSKDYPPEQLASVLWLSYHVCTIAAEVWDWPDDPFSKWRLFTHFEWTTRKIDCAGGPDFPVGYADPSDRWHRWLMDPFRADVRQLTPATPEPPTAPDQGDHDMAQINALKIRLQDKTGQLYDDQLVGLTIANPGQLHQIDADDDRLFVARVDGTRAELEAELGFTLTPSKAQ